VSGQAEQNARTCRILFLGAPAGAPETLLLFAGNSAQKVELPQMNFSPVYKLPAGPLVLRMAATAPEKPELIHPQAPKASLAETVTDFYLLVTSDPANSVVPVKLQIIDADSARFRKGQMLWFNLTPNSVGGTVGSTQLKMAGNSRTILDAPASGSEDFPVNISFRMPGNDRLYPLCETKWQHDPRSRTVLFVVAQPGGRTPRILGFPDYRETGSDKE
jgi:hypothetical protein